MTFDFFNNIGAERTFSKRAISAGCQAHIAGKSFLDPLAELRLGRRKPNSDSPAGCKVLVLAVEQRVALQREQR